MDFMNGAHHFNIGTNIVYSIQGDATINGTPTDVLSEARKLLDKARAVEAGHTSDTAAQATKCSPGTRKQIIADIAGWVTNPDQTTIPSSKPIVWFSGPAGGGKTTVMRNVVNKCERTGLVVASYFFSGRATLTSKRPFVATISHQLADNIILEWLILQAIHRRPSLFNESLELQLQRLVIDPLKSDEFRFSESPMQKVVIAIDGFDECDTKEQRKHLLGLLLTLVEALPESIRVILASRPENDIQTAFSRSLEPFTHRLELTQYDGAEDTRIYMCDEFQEIRETHPMKSAIPDNWPVQWIMDVLVEKSSGFFVLPSVLMKHLANPRRNPVQALDEVLAAKASSSSLTGAHPFAELDALYYIILHPPDTDLVLMRRLLHILLKLGPTTHFRSTHHSTSFLDKFCFLTPGSADITFCDLHSVLSIPSSDSSGSTGVTFHHQSMRDYLTDPNRSLDMYQTPAQTLTDILILSTHHLQDWEKDPTHDVDCTKAAVCRYPHILKGLLDCQDKPELPQAVLDFDPRIIPQWWSVHHWLLDTSGPCPQETFHKKMCKNRLFCRRLCRLMWRVNRWRRPQHDMFRMGGIDAHPQFRAESGLYDPPDRSDDIWRWFLIVLGCWIPHILRIIFNVVVDPFFGRILPRQALWYSISFITGY